MDFKDIIVKLKNTKDSVSVLVHSPTLALQEVQLSWKIPALKNANILGPAKWKLDNQVVEFNWSSHAQKG